MTTETPVSATFIYIDRRKSGRGKSLPNRQKLLKRIKDSIKAAKPEDIDAGGVKGSSSSGKTLANPVKVARDALSEPTFRYAQHSGELEIVLPGNDRWLKGDVFPTSEDDEDGTGQGSGGPGEDGEDDFVVNISRSEFYDVFFEDCELPDLEQSTERELPEAVLKPAGFQKEGSPGQLSVIRSYRNSLGRRRALTFDDREELQVLEAQLDALMAKDYGSASENELWAKEVQTISIRIQEIKDRIASIPVFEKVDHRYRKSDRVLVKSADATLVMAMDVSGSMDEDRKRIARKFFSLQYAFIKRKYPNTDLVFIYHTDTPFEVTEEEFFTARKNGGTIISPAIALAHQIINERYDAKLTNIYFSYAGDGDNWESDNALVIAELEERGFLSKLRHAVYAQVGGAISGWGGTQSGQAKFWTAMTSVANTSKKLHLAKIGEDSEVFAAFKKIYGTKKVKA